jgi:hypothetical protein
MDGHAEQQRPQLRRLVGADALTAPAWVINPAE